MPEAFSATALAPKRVRGIAVTPRQVEKLIEDNLESGLAYGLIAEGLLEIRILNRVVVPVLSGHVSPLSASGLFGYPKITFRCGSCGRSSKSRLEPLTIDGTRQQSSIIHCEACGTANIANVFIRSI